MAMDDKARRDTYWFVSTPRQSGKNWWRHFYEEASPDLARQLADEYRRAKFLLNEQSIGGWDLAKPGSDQMVVHPAPAWRDGFKALKDDSADPERRALPADLVKPCAPVQSEPDRIWDLIVLAARSSRYE